MEVNFWKGSFISRWRYGKMDLTLELRILTNNPKSLYKETVGQEEHSEFLSRNSANLMISQTVIMLKLIFIKIQMKKKLFWESIKVITKGRYVVSIVGSLDMLDEATKPVSFKTKEWSKARKA